MNKQDLIAKISTDNSITKKESEQMLDIVLTAISNGLNETGEVSLHGFGKFEKKLKTGREGTVQVGPKKGQKFKTDDKYSPVFKAGKLLKNLLNNEVA